MRLPGPVTYARGSASHDNGSMPAPLSGHHDISAVVWSRKDGEAEEAHGHAPETRYFGVESYARWPRLQGIFSSGRTFPAAIYKDYL